MAQSIHTLAEPWDRLSIASLAAGAAAAHPARPFLMDCPARARWNGEEPRALTFGEFIKRAAFFGAQLITLGLQPGETVLLLLPNCVEAMVSIVGCRMAGLVPAPAPIDETVDMLRAAAERIQASAIITTGKVESLAIGEKARQIAAKVMSIRCVAGFGLGLPDGIVPLDGWSEEDVTPLPSGVSMPQSSDGLITFAREDGAVCAYIRSEAQLIADALALATANRIDHGQPIVSVLQPAGAASIVASLILPLFAGASVHLIGPFQSDVFIDTMERALEGHLIGPDHFVARVLEQRASDPRLAGLAGAIALARPDSDVTFASDGMPLSRLIDFCEAGLLTLGSKSGSHALFGTHHHAMEGVLPEGVPLLIIEQISGDLHVGGGFSAPRIVRRGEALASGRAA